MQVVEAMQVIEDVTYRPGWRIEPHKMCTPTLLSVAVAVKVPDVNGACDDAELGGHFHVDTTMTELAILDQIDAIIAEIEAHERNEWLKFRGRHVVQPVHIDSSYPGGCACTGRGWFAPEVS